MSCIIFINNATSYITEVAKRLRTSVISLINTLKGRELEEVNECKDFCLTANSCIHFSADIENYFEDENPKQKQATPIACTAPLVDSAVDAFHNWLVAKRMRKRQMLINKCRWNT